MSVPTTPSGHRDGLLAQIRALLDKNKPELQKLWKEEACSDFEPVAKPDLQAALIYHLTCGSKLTARSRSLSPVATEKKPAEAFPPSQPITSNQSFKQALQSPATPTNLRSSSSKIEQRLADTERLLRAQAHSLKVLNQKAEVLNQKAAATEREARKLNLVLYNIPEQADTAGKRSGLPNLNDAINSYVDDHSELDTLKIETCVRLGKLTSEQKRPRPMRLAVYSEIDKHLFLKYVKELRQRGGVRCDDDLTKLQQKERQELSADFETLKQKGHQPFFRGAVLKYRHADKTRNCRPGQAHKAPNGCVQ